MNKLLAIIASVAALFAVSTAHAEDTTWFGGPTVGAGFGGGATVGLDVGYQFNRYGRAEVTYDHMFQTGPWNLDNLGMNLIGQIPTGTFVTPYVLAGMGYQWQNGINQGVWNVGGGVRMEVTPKFEIDLRYRYIQGLYNQTNNNFVGIGTSFKF